MDSVKYLKIKGKNTFSIFSDSGNKKVVIFCHGFRGDTTGPNRFFVRLARKLNEKGISSLRFDQYGCGNSEGDFENSTFSNWVNTTTALANKYLKRGYQVSLFGQSMGGACVIVVGSKLGSRISSLVAWSPGIIKDKPIIKGKYMYEKGQRMKWDYWIEAYQANVVKSFSKLKTKTLLFIATKDEYVPPSDQKAIIKATKSHQTIETLEGEVHSQWSYEVAEKVIAKTANFLVSNFK